MVDSSAGPRALGAPGAGADRGAMTSSTAVPLEVRGLVKSYAGRVAVDELGFHCRPGTVTGLLGANGAGKTTTLRILTGLTAADRGEALVGGRRYRDLPRPGRTLGVMLDTRSLHGGRTVIETLRLAARSVGVPVERAEVVLEQVGLEEAATRRVSACSPGLRRRLGIGVALIGDPAALVLDEPANGLDPDGIRWLRRLLRSFADAGGTVLVTSHRLREMQAVVDRLVVISRGRLVREGTLEEISLERGTRVAATDMPALRAALDRHGIASEPRADGQLEVSLAAEDMGRLALREQLVLTALGDPDHAGLEDGLLSLTAPTGTLR